MAVSASAATAAATTSAECGRASRAILCQAAASPLDPTATTFRGDFFLKKKFDLAPVFIRDMGKAHLKMT